MPNTIGGRCEGWAYMTTRPEPEYSTRASLYAPLFGCRVVVEMTFPRARMRSARGRVSPAWIPPIAPRTSISVCGSTVWSRPDRSPTAHPLETSRRMSTAGSRGVFIAYMLYNCPSVGNPVPRSLRKASTAVPGLGEYPTGPHRGRPGAHPVAATSAASARGAETTFAIRPIFTRRVCGGLAGLSNRPARRTRVAS